MMVNSKNPSKVSTFKNLTQEPPRSPRTRLGDYALAARMADKGRATLHGVPGEYHFACPLDQMLFGFKGVQADDVKSLLASGATDEQLIDWLNSNGAPKTVDEIREWGAGVEAYRPYEDPERKDWFAEECAKLGLKPESATLFDYLEADDVVTFKK
jgi:hypothetical protein